MNEEELGEALWIRRGKSLVILTERFAEQGDEAACESHLMGLVRKLYNLLVIQTAGRPLVSRGTLVGLANITHAFASEQESERGERLIGNVAKWSPVSMIYT